MRREEARAVLERAGHDEGLALYWWGAAQEAWLKATLDQSRARWNIIANQVLMARIDPIALASLPDTVKLRPPARSSPE